MENPDSLHSIDLRESPNHTIYELYDSFVHVLGTKVLPDFIWVLYELTRPLEWYNYNRKT